MDTDDSDLRRFTLQEASAGPLPWVKPAAVDFVTISHRSQQGWLPLTAAVDITAFGKVLEPTGEVDYVLNAMRHSAARKLCDEGGKTRLVSFQGYTDVRSNENSQQIDGHYFRRKPRTIGEPEGEDNDVL